MGTMIQGHRLDRNHFHGDRFHDHHCEQTGNNDLLTLTQPRIIAGIHASYLEAGADIVETNTFNSTRIAMADYGLEQHVRELNAAGARLARDLADEFSARTPDKPRFVAGVLGPTNRTASISPDVADPGARNVSFDELVFAYTEAIEGLTEGGADLLLVADDARLADELIGHDRLRTLLGSRLSATTFLLPVELRGRLEPLRQIDQFAPRRGAGAGRAEQGDRTRRAA